MATKLEEQKQYTPGFCEELFIAFLLAFQDSLSYIGNIFWPGADDNWKRQNDNAKYEMYQLVKVDHDEPDKQVKRTCESLNPENGGLLRGMYRRLNSTFNRNMDSVSDQTTYTSKPHRQYRGSSLVQEYRRLNLKKDDDHSAFHDYLRKKVEPFMRKEGAPSEDSPDTGVKTMTAAFVLKIAHMCNRFRKIMIDSIRPTRDGRAISNEETDGDKSQQSEPPRCWDINKRGAVKETILHLCYLNNTETYKAIGRALLKCYPELASDIYEHEYYYGESALHIAIINGDLDAVKLLVNCGAELNRRATGRFFTPNDPSINDYGGRAYLGEYPLAFAASTGNIEIYDYLMKHGQDRVNPDAKDSYGNTVVHMTIIHNQRAMFDHAVKYAQRQANFLLPNKNGLTPLQLSYELGRKELFTHLLELTSQMQWEYGDLACHAYPLSVMDSIELVGASEKHEEQIVKPNPNSALRTIVQRDSQYHLEMLEDDVVKTLLDKKWNLYGKCRFLQLFLLAILHQFLLSAIVYMRPEDNLMNISSALSLLRMVVEIGIIISCVAKLTFELSRIRSLESPINYFVSLIRTFPFKGLYMLSTILILVCIPCRLLQLRHFEDTLLILCSLFSWSYMFFFFKGLKRLGAPIVMIGKMLSQDVLRFTIIYAVFFITFTKVFYFLFREDDQSSMNAFGTWSGSITSVLRLSLGNFDVFTFKDCRYPLIGYFTYVIFLVLVPVLLLNVLIAMMGKTYEEIQEHSLMQWKRQWAMIVLHMEESISGKDLACFYLSYSANIKIPRKDAIKQGLISEKGLHSCHRDFTNENQYLEKDDTEPEFYRALLVEKQLTKSRNRIDPEIAERWKMLVKRMLADELNKSSKTETQSSSVGKSSEDDTTITGNNDDYYQGYEDDEMENTEPVQSNNASYNLRRRKQDTQNL